MCQLVLGGSSGGTHCPWPATVRQASGRSRTGQHWTPGGKCTQKGLLRSCREKPAGSRVKSKRTQRAETYSRSLCGEDLGS